MVQGSGREAPRVELPITPTARMTLQVVVDLESGRVTLTVDGKSTSLELERQLSRISYVGYGVQNAITEFGELEVVDSN